jgi:putative PIN family toxin of toxin-antitoxin system
MSASIPPASLRAVVDTNLFVSGLLIPPASLPARLVNAAIAHSFTLVTSPALDAELREVLARPKLTEHYQIDPAIQQALLDRIATAEHVIPSPTLPFIVRDPKDEKVLACALMPGVAYLVTGDDDLLVLDGDPAIGSLRIITVRQFLDLLP